MSNLRPSNSTNSDVLDVLAKVRANFLARGAGGIKQYGRIFRIMDDDRSQKLSKEEFSTGMKDLKVDATADTIDKLFREFDRDGSGQIDFDEFLLALRPKMNEKREALVMEIFKKLDKDGNRVITVKDISTTHNAAAHPKFKSGEWTRENVLRNFLERFEAEDHVDGKVTLDEFKSYYDSVSASIDDDGYFIMMVKNSWNLK